MRFLRKRLIGVFLFGVTLALLAWAGQMDTSAVQERMARDTSAPPAQARDTSSARARRSSTAHTRPGARAPRGGLGA